jgi:hypothetical protein
MSGDGKWRMGHARDDTRVEAFVFNWKGHEANAHALERALRPFTKVTVINSEELPGGGPAHWVNLDDSAYFAAQWNRALELFDGDLLLHVQADARFEDFGSLLARVRFLSRDRVGVYEPNVDYSSLNYDRARLPRVDEQAFEVPMTDCTCWCIDGDLVRRLPKVDVSINKYGWGITAAVAALCALTGKRCVRDYSFTVRHPRRRGYSSEIAHRERRAYLQALDPALASEALRVYERLGRVRIHEAVP